MLPRSTDAVASRADEPVLYQLEVNWTAVCTFIGGLEVLGM